MLLASRALGVVLVLVGGFVAPSSTSAGSPATGVDAGDVVVVDAVNTTRALVEFDGTDAFRLQLPAGATCSGDSANDDYRVQTFLVPADTDLATLTYGYRNPDGNDLYRALRYVDGELSSQAMTDQNAEPGQPALILEYRLPFTFAHYPENSLPPGPWKIGVACTGPASNVEKYWDAEVELERAPEVQPSGLRIRVTGVTSSAPADDTESRDGWSVPPAAIVAAVLIGVLLFIFLRSGRRTPSHPKEIS